MIKLFKQWYTEEYQSIVYAIGVAKSEYEKIGAFVTSTLLVITVLKLFFNVPKWLLIGLLPFVTFTAYFIGKFLIVMGVPKKTASLSNQQSPELMEILERLKRLENGR